MKKIYFLLAALLMGAVSAMAAGRVIFTETSKSSNNYYLQINNATTAVAPQNSFSTFRTYAQSASITNLKLTYQTGTVGSNWTTGNFNPPNEFTAVWYNDDNTYGGNYECKPYLRGTFPDSQVTKDGNDSWDHYVAIDTYVSGTTYKSQTLTYENSVNFQVVLRAGSDNKQYLGFNKTFNANNATSSDAANGNTSTISLTNGDKYHFEMDMATFTLKLVVEPAVAPTTLYLTYQNNSTTLNNYSKYQSATASNNVFTWTGVLSKGDVFAISTGYGSSSNVSAGQYGPSSNGSYYLSNNASNISISKSTPNCFYVNYGGDGTYTVTVDFSNVSSPKFSISWVEKAIEKCATPVISIPNGVNQGKNVYYFVTTLSCSTANAKIYYTTDGSTPSNDVENTTSKLYRAPFQIAGETTVKAIAYADNYSASSVATNAHHASNTFDWETTKDADRMATFKVKLAAEPVNGAVAKLTASLTDASGATSSESNFYSWAKYEDFDALAELNKTIPDVDIEALSDHTPTADAVDIQQNTTNTHICRNFTPAFYRVYVQTDNTPDPASTVKSLMSVRTFADDEPMAVDDVDYSTTAGDVDPTYESRIAYTEYVVEDPNDGTTGVEEVVADNVADTEEDAPVVYYNLSGLRVENPSNGIFIRVQGNKVTKELIR